MIQTIIGDNLDISDIVKSIKTSGKKDSPTRTCSIELLDDSQNYIRSGIDITKGNTIRCYFTGRDKVQRQIFSGTIFTKNMKSSGTMSVKSYDKGFKLTQNKACLSYYGWSGSDIFIDICRKFNLPVNKVDYSKYSLESIVGDGVTLWDIIKKARDEIYTLSGNGTYGQGEYYYVYVDNTDRLNFLKRKPPSDAEWIVKLSPDTNMKDWEYSSDFSKIVTRTYGVQDGNTVRTYVNDKLEKYFGTYQSIVKIGKDDSDQKINQSVLKDFTDNSVPRETIKVNAIGEVGVQTGSCVWVEIPQISTEYNGQYYTLAMPYYVSEDSEEFTNGDDFTMSLTLQKATEFDRI